MSVSKSLQLAYSIVLASTSKDGIDSPFFLYDSASSSQLSDTICEGGGGGIAVGVLNGAGKNELKASTTTMPPTRRPKNNVDDEVDVAITTAANNWLPTAAFIAPAK